MRAQFKAQPFSQTFDNKRANQISFVISLLSTVSSEFHPRVMGNQRGDDTNESGDTTTARSLPGLYSVVTDFALAKRQYSPPTASL